MGIRGEVVVEGDVLLENDDEVLDRGLGAARARILLAGACRNGVRPLTSITIMASAATARGSVRYTRSVGLMLDPPLWSALRLWTDTAYASEEIPAERYGVMSAT